MTDPATPAARPPYWGQCEWMSLAELDRFIHDAARRLSDPSVTDDGNTPRSHEEFWELCALLWRKVDASKQDETMLERPDYQGPPNPGYYLTPSLELEALYRRLQKAQRRVEQAIEDHDSPTYVEYLEEEVEKVQAEIAPVEQREQERHDERRRQYEKAYEPHRRLLQLWQAEAAQVEQRRKANEKLDSIVERAYRRVDRAFNPRRRYGNRGPTTLDFEILPPGKRTNEHVREYYREVLRHGQLKGFSQDRLDKMLALPRSGWLKGQAGFYGYIVLMFDHTEKVLLEYPVEGNAIYVLDSGEERLLRMSKQELINSSEAKRIVHAGTWYQRLKDELGIE